MVKRSPWTETLKMDKASGCERLHRTPLLPSFGVMLFRWDHIHFEIWPLSVTFTHPEREWTMIDLWAPMWSLYEAFSSSFNPVREHSRWKREVLALRTALSSNLVIISVMIKELFLRAIFQLIIVYTHASPWEQWEWVRNRHRAGKDQTEKSLCSNA